MECPGSFAYPANTEDGESSTFADDGTMSHTWAALALTKGWNAEDMIGATGTVREGDDTVYTMDEARAELVQTYLDLVREHSIGREMFVEHRIDLSAVLGPDQGGTLDCGIVGEDYVDIIDLKGGSGHKVFASYLEGKKRLPNHQLGLYAEGFILDAEMMGAKIKTVNLIIVQPKLHHIDIQSFTRAEIAELAQRAAAASINASECLTLTPEQAAPYMNPSDATCLWCRAKAQCPKLAAYVAEQVDADFETILAEPPGKPADLGRAMAAVPLILQWCGAVQDAVHKAVSAGDTVLGTDGEPMKFVEGKLGSRKWIDEEAAAAALVGQIGPKAYQPQRIITAPVAAKLLDKKATKQLWTDLFEPIIHKPPGRPQLALGSDPRPAYTPTTDDDFDEIKAE